MLTAPRKRLFTVDEYHAMAEAGIIGADERVELIEGEIILKAAISSRHQAAVDRLSHLLGARVGERAIVRVQGPVRLARITEPQPDLQLLAPRNDFYAAAHPSQQEALLVIEVADSSLRFDRDEKALIYARRGVRELWIVDLNGERVLVRRRPGEAGYGESLEVTRGASLAPQAFPDARVSIDELLGPR